MNANEQQVVQQQDMRDHAHGSQMEFFSIVTK